MANDDSSNSGIAFLNIVTPLVFLEIFLWFLGLCMIFVGLKKFIFSQECYYN